MRIIPAICLSLLILINQASYAASAEDTQKLRAYVQELIQEGYDMVHDTTLSKEARREKASAIIKSHLHLDWMAKYTLGRHRRTISKDRIDEFIKVYSLFVVKAYADLIANYNGEKAILTNIKQIDDDMFIVNTELIKPGAQSPIKVDYLVHKLENKKEDPYLVGDIITEGISILNSQQAEFNGVISSHGIDRLIADLKTRVKSSNSSANGTKNNKTKQR